MIQHIYKDEDEIDARTTGCSCCSNELRINGEMDDDEKQEIKVEMLNELGDNLRVLDEACSILGITIDELRQRS